MRGLESACETICELPPECETNATSEVARFFDGQTIFLTGATGFLGSVLLEKLLRDCPGIRKIYILVRTKKGVEPEDRKREIFKKAIFSSLAHTNPDVFKKVEVIKGGVSEENLGISSSDTKKLENEVTIVFHGAAAVSFGKPLSLSIIQNAIGTKNAVEVSKRMKNIKVFIYVSSYSACYNTYDIYEEVPAVDAPIDELMDAAKRSDEETLSGLTKRFKTTWPNTYSLSKAIAENYVKREMTDIPSAIFRPGIITHTWKGPCQGYVETGFGWLNVSLWVAKGFLQVVPCDQDVIAPMVPVDVTANAVITTAWYVGTKKHNELFVLNCAYNPFRTPTWSEIFEGTRESMSTYPLPKTFQKPEVVLRKNTFAYWISSLVNHYVPALFLDLVSLLTGNKAKLIKTLNSYHYCIHLLKPFLVWKKNMRQDNLLMLIASLNPLDQEIFYINMKDLDAKEHIKCVFTEPAFTKWETDKRTFHDRMSIAYKRWIVTTSIKWCFVLLFYTLLSFCLWNMGKKFLD